MGEQARLAAAQRHLVAGRPSLEGARHVGGELRDRLGEPAARGEREGLGAGTSREADHAVGAGDREAGPGPEDQGAGQGVDVEPGLLEPAFERPRGFGAPEHPAIYALAHEVGKPA